MSGSKASDINLVELKIYVPKRTNHILQAAANVIKGIITVSVLTPG